MSEPRKQGCDDCGWRDYVYPVGRNGEMVWVCSHEAGPDRVAPDGPPWPVCVWWKPRPKEDMPDSYRSKDLPDEED